jgi:hypothetical protein
LHENVEARQIADEPVGERAEFGLVAEVGQDIVGSSA